MENSLLIELIQEIRTLFPDASVETEKWLNDRGLNCNNEYAWLESFADRTNDLIRCRDNIKFDEHMKFFEGKLNINIDEINRFIDVSYVENLLWNLSIDDRRWAWPKLPTNIKNLYLGMWGEPRL